MIEVSTRSVKEAAAAEQLRANTSTLDIPKGFDLWTAEEISEWLDQVEDDPGVSDADFYEAQQAVRRVLGDDGT
ncbi:hypothetical protein OG302_40190 [Streptomyces sp. NBC_01283]|uniref:hypothetical protein n=1 Tax=Streptomyces sp. NBC_01283 TaxID=2903812 RepID=UPI00352C3AE8|nr:hypothetical protein OG302_40190 [Streptomyces sp. NBC_01283]